jgi:hypothetical protein
MHWLLKSPWLALATGYFLIPINEGPISQTNCDKIKLGTINCDAEKLLGEPVYWIEVQGEGSKTIWKDEVGNKIIVISGNASSKDAGVTIGKQFIPTTRSYFELTKRRFELLLWP